MTLVIGVKYPCGIIKEALASLRFASFPEAIILATDSRWTKYYPLRNDPIYEDVATKLFTFPNNNAIIAYSGDVQAGEHCIKEFERNLQKNHMKNMTTSLYIIQRAFQRTYNHHKKSRTVKIFPLYFLLGVCDNIGKCSLIYFGSPKFAPIFLEGIKGIGIIEACKSVENEIYKKINQIDNVKNQEDVMHFGMFIAGTMNDLAMRSEKYSGIGGFIQVAILNRKEIIQPSLSWTTDPTGKTDTWHRATARSQEITTYQRKYNLGPDFIHINSYRLYSISD